MHRAAEDEGVGGPGFFDGLVDHAAKDTAAACGAAAAADAAADGPGADVEDLGLDVGAVQLLRDEGQSGVGAAFFVGAAVDEQDFHTLHLSF